MHSMFGEFGLDDVLKKLKRADESLTEFVAPLWPGVAQAAVWIEGRPRLYTFREPLDDTGYYLCGTGETQAHLIRPATAEEGHRYRQYLEKASVILLSDALAFPASFAERLQGITTPRPIHFAQGNPLVRITARFDGVNLFYDGESQVTTSPLADLFGNSSIFTPGELLDVPGQDTATGGAEAALHELARDPSRALAYRLQAVMESAGGIIDDWTQTDGGVSVRWRRLDEEHTVLLHTAASPMTSGICLPGARGFDPPALTRLLIDHLLDTWRR